MPENNELVYHQKQTRDNSVLAKIKKGITLLEKTWSYRHFRSSRLNPYHTKLQRFDGETIDEARAKARAENLDEFLYGDVRVSTELNCSIQEEYAKYKNVRRGFHDITDRIPRDSNGQFDLTAEEPILIVIIPIKNSNVGHAALQYKDRVVNRQHYKMDVKPLYPRYRDLGEYYFVYPSQIGVDEKRLLCAINKANVARAGSYNFIYNNCAGAVDYTLKQAGVKDLDHYGPDNLGVYFPSPGNNPFHIGIQDWCRKHGIHVYSREVEQYYKYNTMPHHEQIAEEHKSKRERYLELSARKKPLNKIRRNCMYVLKNFLSVAHYNR